MAQETARKFTHIDIELMRLRLSISPGQRIQAMLDARAVLVGMIRGRLRRQYPELPDIDAFASFLARDGTVVNLRQI